MLFSREMSLYNERVSDRYAGDGAAGGVSSLCRGGGLKCSMLTVRQSRLEKRKTVELREPLMGSFSTQGSEPGSESGGER